MPIRLTHSFLFPTFFSSLCSIFCSLQCSFLLIWFFSSVHEVEARSSEFRHRPIRYKAIINELNWIPAHEINQESIRKLSKAVGLISLPSKSNHHCTAFLINENVIMTNWHCFENASSVKGAKLYLEFYTGRNKQSYKGTKSYNCERYLWGSRLLDTALLHCSGSPGKTHGYLQLDSSPPKLKSENVFLIHQNCNYMKRPNCPATKKVSPGIALFPSPSQLGREHPIFYHTGDTLSGSSGAPVISEENHKVIGLHQAGPGVSVYVNGDEDKNEAISMHLIIEAIKEELPHLQIHL